MLLAGGIDTLRAANWARISKKPLLPISRFGGAAEQNYFEELRSFDQRHMGRLEKPDFENLSQTASQPEDFARTVIYLAEEVQSSKSVKKAFLGYCHKSVGVAAQIQLLLEKLGVSVLNWAMDFRVGYSILSEIENASAVCSCGIFLFSEDDPLEGKPGVAAPRDNVVFEAGYFMSSKGPARCLIIRHGDAKMPADVGGAIYVHLAKTADVGSIEGRLSDFVAGNL